MGFVLFISPLVRLAGMNGSSCTCEHCMGDGFFWVILSLMRLYAIWVGGSCEWQCGSYVRGVLVG